MQVTFAAALFCKFFVSHLLMIDTERLNGYNRIYRKTTMNFYTLTERRKINRNDYSPQTASTEGEL